MNICFETVICHFVNCIDFNEQQTLVVENDAKGIDTQLNI